MKQPEKKPPIFHPLLFTVYPILFFYSVNTDQIVFSAIWQSLMLTVLVVALLVFLLAKKMGWYKASLLATAGVTIFFGYGHLKRYIVTHSPLELSWAQYDTWVLPVVLLLWAFLTVRTLRSKRNFYGATQALNAIGVILLGMVLYSTVSPGDATLAVANSYKDGQPIADNVVVDFSQKKVDQKPDVYYLIFDRYGSKATLERELGYDNTSFYNALRERGFYIAEKSTANYPKTYLSLASSMNLTHLTYMSDRLHDTGRQAPIYAMLQEHALWRLLEAQGYKYHHVGSWWTPTSFNKHADENYNYRLWSMNEFSSALFDTSIAQPIVSKALVGRYGLTGLNRLEQKTRTPFIFEELKKIPEFSGPKLVFAHVLIPHPPYIFDANGKPLTESESYVLGDQKGYLEQLKYTNTQILEIVDKIQSAGRPAIVVLQSDEGPCSELKAYNRRCGEKTDLTKLSDAALKGHGEILNAYHFPDQNYSGLYQNITPVNTFRVIFNQYFGTNFEKLPDANYIFKDLNRPYQFIDATDRIQ